MKKVIILIATIISITVIIIIAFLKGGLFNHITYTNSFYCFDTTVEITIYDEKNADRYYNYIKNEFKEISSSCDDYNGDLKRLNEEREIYANDYLIDIINTSLELKDKTNGYFNPFIGRLTHLYKENSDDITEEIIKNELKIMNESQIIIDENNIRIIGDANIDLGAITKGYATKLAKDYLDKCDVNKYILNVGQSSISIGNNKTKIGLLKPNNEGYYKYIKIKNLGISTSAPSYQKYHLISPLTGIQEDYYKTLSIISDNDLYNDVYSTACFSMDKDTFNSFVKENKLSYYYVDKEDNVFNG